MRLSIMHFGRHIGRAVFLLIIILPILPGMPAAAQVSNLVNGKRAILKDSLFQSGSAIVSQGRTQFLDSIGTQLKSTPELSVEVDGFADNHGPAEANVKLSEDRAINVKRYLAEKFEIPSGRIITKGFGAKDPIADNTTEEGRSQNRRVEIVPLTPLTKRPVISVYDEPINQEGRISFLQSDVSTKPPWTPLFSDARLNQPVYELHKIHTLSDSRSVVTFNDLSEMKIGSNTMIIIYGHPLSDVRPERKENVELMTGGLLTKLRSLSPEHRFVVKTPAASIAMKAETDSKVGVDLAERSVVSIFNGEADVSAQDTSVSVPQGFGTEVKKGEAPAPPRPLPPSPIKRFPLYDSIVSSAAGIEFRWSPTTQATRLDVSRDSSFDGIVASPVTGDSSIRTALEPGGYYVRLIGVDPGGLESDPMRSEPLTVVDSASYNAVLNITNPEGLNAATDLEDFGLRGRVGPGSRVTINGDPVSTDSTGVFVGRCRLNEGLNSFAVSALDRLNGRASKTVNIHLVHSHSKFALSFSVSVLPKHINYESFTTGDHFTAAGEYLLEDNLGIGLAAGVGQMFLKSTAPNGPSNPTLATAHMYLRRDVFEISSLICSIDAGAGATGWFMSGGSPAAAGAPSWRGGLTIRSDDTPLAFAVGAHVIGIIHDEKRFDPASSATNHAIVTIDLGVFLSKFK